LVIQLPDGSIRTKVEPVYAFPVSETSRYISLIDEEPNEIGIIEDMKQIGDLTMSEFDAGQQGSGHRERRRKQRHGGGERKRDNVVMVRVDEGDLNRIDELVDSGQFNSRSEATAFLISEGIKAKQQMFEKMAGKISQIQNLRTELGAMIAEDTKPSETVDPEPDNAGGS
jgi:Arc/MetJ-type ribon-helix-helix transcriptional regulator